MPQPTRQPPRNIVRVALILVTIAVAAVLVTTLVVSVASLRREEAAPPYPPNPSGVWQAPSTSFSATAVPGLPLPSDTSQPPIADWQQSFDEFLRTVGNGQAGLIIAAVGAPERSIITLGDWPTGSAWSTIKVPLAIAALRDSATNQDSPAITAAITLSDNGAANELWASLGDPEVAAKKVAAVLRAQGDDTSVQTEEVYPPWSPYGQTIWALADQVKFLSGAVCDTRNEPIFDLMTQIKQDQGWGLGAIPGAMYKGGWGPVREGGYLVRQMGVIPSTEGLMVVSMAFQTDGDFSDGTAALSKMTDWLLSREQLWPTGECGVPYQR